MNKSIKSTNFNIREDLKEHSENKIDSLSIFEPISTDLLLKLENSDNENKKAELDVKLKGHTFFAEHTSESFEKSINKVVSKVRKQMVKHKEKIKKKK